MLKSLDSTKYLLSAQVKAVCEAECIGGDELEQMLNKAAIASHEYGNRRFHDWVFTVSGKEVETMVKGDPVTCHRQGQTNLTVTDECEGCYGEGCKECGWRGELLVVYRTKK